MKKKKIPKFKSEKEEALFWDTHSPLDYPNEVTDIEEKDIKFNLYGSDCCEAPLKMKTGKTTIYFVCDKCGKLCKRVKIGEIR